MKRIYLILLGLVLGIYMTGCYGDKGNYDYQWIQDIEIDSLFNFKKDSTITVSRSQVLKIDVDLKKIILGTENETEVANPEDYIYEWKVLANNSTLDEDMILSTEKNLNDTIWLGEGSYQVNYSVTEKNSGVTWITYFKLRVVTRYTGGHIFLTEDANQNIEIELWATVPDNAERVHETGVLARSGFPYTKGGAKFVKRITDNYAGNGVWIATGENTGWLNLPNFDWSEGNLIGMYMTVPDENDYIIENIVDVTNTQSKIIYCKSGHILVLKRGGINPTITYTNSMEFKAAPYFGGNDDAALVWDETNKRFVMYQWAQSTIPTVEPNCYETTEEYAYQGYELLYMTERSNYVNTIAVLQDPENNYHVCNFEMRDNGGSYINYVVSDYEIEGNISSLENASYMAIDKSNSFFYWSQSNKIYVSYHPSSSVSDCVEVSLQDTEGNTVTITDDICMLTQCNNDLCIATWSDTNKGKAYIVSTNQSDSRRLTVQNIFETNNPVKSVTTW